MTFSIEFEGENSEEIEFWNGPQGMNWVKRFELTDLMYGPYGAKAIDAANLETGDRVLEIGCGCGTTAQKLAEVVAPDGHVTAVDVAVPMLKIAEGRIGKRASIVDFLSADAATYGFEPESYDVLFSQFGVMFFSDPDVAFSNLIRALKPNGRISFVCWQRPDLNPWLMIAFDAVREFVPQMPTPKPGVPQSAFALAQEMTIRDILSGVGFVDIQIEEFKPLIKMGRGTLEECLSFAVDFSTPVSTALRTNDTEAAPAILKAVRDAFEPYYTGETIEIPSSSWIVTARRP